MSLLALALLFAGLFGPGFLLRRLIGGGTEPVAAFLGSVAILVNLLLAMNALNVPLTSSTIAAGLSLTCCMLLAAARQRKPHALTPTATVSGKMEPTNWWFLLPAGLGVFAITFYAWVNPLAGYDTAFRWDFLARQIFTQERLDFYPPVSAAHYTLYGWPDGIAPLVSALYLWTYHAGGEISTRAAFFAIVLQGWLLFSAVYCLASERHGRAAGVAAIAVLASSAVLLWGISIGQETGITALSLTAMFLFLRKGHAGKATNEYVWAGLAAGVGALAREYGLIFIAVGVAHLVLEKTARKPVLLFVATAVAVCAPWYLRNWVLTGNPLWPHDFAGVFPSHPLHQAYIKAVQSHLGLGTTAAAGGKVSIVVAALLAVPLILGVAGCRHRPNPKGQIFGVVAVVLIWLWSINQTSGGYVYSTRVLTPAVALLAVSAGSLLATVRSRKLGVCAVAALLVATVDASARMFFMPANSEAAWWRTPRPGWLAISNLSHFWNEHPVWRTLTGAASDERIAVDSPFMHAALVRAGARPVTFYSPDLQFLFDNEADYGASIAQLRRLQIRFVLISKDSGIQTIQFQGSPFFQRLMSLRPTVQAPVADIYDVGFLDADLKSNGEPSPL
jgi:hypothetical protein